MAVGFRQHNTIDTKTLSNDEKLPYNSFLCCAILYTDSQSHQLKQGGYVSKETVVLCQWRRVDGIGYYKISQFYKLS